MSTPHEIDELRQQGLSYSEIGVQLGSTKDAVRGVHRRWLQGSAAGVLAAIRAAGDGDAGGDIPGGAVVSDAGPSRASRRASSGAAGLRSDIEVARAAITKATRTEIRLKYSLLADAEINDVLPARLREFDAAVQAGFIPAYAMRLVDGDG